MAWQTMTGNGPELFERYLVPALFQALALELISRSPPQPGERVLDLACGTGVVARLAAERVGATGRVVGLDISAGMLAVARATSSNPTIEWLEGSADSLPFPDGSFDRALCQQGLQYFPDRSAAVRELRRVLAPGGRLAISVFCSSEAHDTVAAAIAPHLGESARRLALEACSLSDPSEIRTLIEAAGFHELLLERRMLTASFSTPEEFPTYVLASRFPAVVEALPEASRRALWSDLLGALAPFTSDQGVDFRTETHLATATA
jgi:ubiquinone/menaquinone biosynthesis C-methylase UbiE